MYHSQRERYPISVHKHDHGVLAASVEKICRTWGKLIFQASNTQRREKTSGSQVMDISPQ